MKISKITLLVALTAGLNLVTVSISAMDDMNDQTVVYEENDNYVPIVTPVAESTKDVVYGAGRVAKGAVGGTGEILTGDPVGGTGEIVTETVGGTADAVEGAIKLPGRLFGVID